MSIAPDPAEVRAERVAEAKARWTDHLVELGGPNTLLWYRDLPAGTLDLSSSHLGTRNSLLGGATVRLTELVREPAALDDARRRADRVHAAATELEAGHGIRTTFLGIGTASWTVVLANGTVVPREPAAPVLLRACRLRPADARHRDWVLEPGTDLEVNPALVQYLTTEHGIGLDTARLEALATATGGVDPYPVFAALAQACSAVPDFAVTPRVVLSTFPYYKAPLVADLGTATDLAGDDVVAALAGYGDALPAVTVGPDTAGLTDEPGRGCVLEADPAQRDAVEAVRAGSHLSLVTPPGTGATQTVANLVSALAADGKRVLLVSPTRASLRGVTDRLDEVGLADLVLDLPDGGHGRSAVVDALLGSLDRVLADPSGGPDTGRGSSGLGRDTAEAARVLDTHVAALHGRRDPWDTTLYEVQEEVSRHARLDVPPRSRVRVSGAVLARLDRATLDEAVEALTSLAEHSAWDGDGVDDPWFAATLRTTEEAEEAAARVERLSRGGVEDARSTFADVFRGIHLPEHPTVLDWHRVLSTVGQVRDTLETFRPEIFDIPLGDLVAATASASVRRELGSDLGMAERWRIRRQARSLLRPGRPPADLHAALVEAQEQRHAWRELAGSGGRPEIPVELDRAQAAHDQLLDDLTWLDARLPVGEDERRLVDVDLRTVGQWVDELAAARTRLTAAPRVRVALDRVELLGLGELVADLRARRVPADRVATELRWVWWCSVADEISSHDPRVLEHDGAALTEAVLALREADDEARASRAPAVRAAVAARVQDVRRTAPAQETELRAQGGRATRPDPLPDLLRRMPDLLTALRPCWAMSPLSVPSVVPPGAWFDVVVLEEASLIAPAEAVAALTRASQVVVVGDPLQLPPAPFVVSAGADAPEDSGEGSVLDALGGALPARRLTWHYRALDERLVAFADAELYDGALVTFPGTESGPVVRHVAVDGHGVVAEGEAAVESTPDEVVRVVELVLEHARTRADRSLAVVALTPTHRRLVRDALGRALDGLPDADLAFFDPARVGRFALRDADQVQGEAWDDVLITVGFGKTPHGRVLHRFGPIGTESGHRRLAVALTRARRTLTVVSTIGADDLDPDRLRTPGARMLRALLAHVEGVARDGGRPESPAGEGRSIVLGDLARRLREQGLVVHEDVGTSAVPLELAVEDPVRTGRLLLAVESDGPSYAGGGSARDRERLRTEQLRRRGWRHLRVWSTDVFRDPARDVARVLEAVGVREAPGD
ncbi:DNA helicase [Phycicoccus sp. CSK15P-2]|nr:DNA helicase [Phycicoccus sp. CSK15P-2]